MEKLSITKSNKEKKMKKIIMTDYLKNLAENSHPQILNELSERGLYDGIGVRFGFEDESGSFVECEGVLHIAGDDKENRPVVWLRADGGGLVPLYEVDSFVVETLCSVLYCKGDCFEEFVVGAFVKPKLEDVKKAFADSGIGDLAEYFEEIHIEEESFELVDDRFFVWERVSLF